MDNGTEENSSLFGNKVFILLCFLLMMLKLEFSGLCLRCLMMREETVAYFSKSWWEERLVSNELNPEE